MHYVCVCVCACVCVCTGCVSLISSKAIVSQAHKHLLSVKIDGLEGLPGQKFLSPDETDVWLVAR